MAGTQGHVLAINGGGDDDGQLPLPDRSLLVVWRTPDGGSEAETRRGGPEESVIKKLLFQFVVLLWRPSSFSCNFRCS